MRGVCRAVVVAGAVFGVALLSAGVASADGSVQVKSRLGNWCLDTPSGNFNTATFVNACDGSPSQRWDINSDGQIESAAYPGACLTAGAVSMWQVTVFPCQMGGFNQHWNIHPNGQIEDSLGSCLTIVNGDAHPGAPVRPFNCGFDGPAQEWDSVS
ncbi:RICIN domain-containing protein [Mycobacterium decipiens]